MIPTEVALRIRCRDQAEFCEPVEHRTEQWVPRLCCCQPPKHATRVVFVDPDVSIQSPPFHAEVQEPECSGRIRVEVTLEVVQDLSDLPTSCCAWPSEASMSEAISIGGS